MDIPSAVRFVPAQFQAASSLGAKVLNHSIPPVRRGRAVGGFAQYQDALNFTYELLKRVRYDAEATGASLALESVAGGMLSFADRATQTHRRRELVSRRHVP